MLASLIETCKLHSVNPQAYLTDVLTKASTTGPIAGSPNSRLGAGLPHTDPGGCDQNQRVKGFSWWPRLIAYDGYRVRKRTLPIRPRASPGSTCH
jgi:IS66 C-terminal element